MNNQGVILDGYHKYRACQELGLESKLDLDANVNRQGKSDIQLANRVEFNRGEWLSPFKDGDKIQEILFIINSNLWYSGTARNQLAKKNKFQRVELGIKIRSILQKIVGSEYISLVGPNRGAKQIYMAPGRADQELGKFVGVGRETIRKVWIILHNATEEDNNWVDRTIIGLKVRRKKKLICHQLRLNRTIIGLKVCRKWNMGLRMSLFESNYYRIERAMSCHMLRMFL